MITLQGICYDEKSSYLRGSAKAPDLVREFLYSNSSNSFTELGLDIKTIDINDKGNFSPQEYFEIESITSGNKELDRKLVTIGGDHSITYPIIKAYAPERVNFDILQIDAHGDLYDNFEGDPYSHACPFARIMEAGLISRLVQVGGRTYTTHQLAQAKKFGVEVHEMKDYRLEKLRFKNPLYITLYRPDFG